MAHYNALQEEELKLVIAEQFFADFDCKPRIGKIDFCVTQIQDAKHVIAGEACLAPTEGRETVSLLWAESKRGIVSDLYKPLVQLILTIGKARTFETYLPPPFLAAFDAEKIAFIPYKDILPFFALNDFNWNITPSDDTSREFGLLYGAVKDTLERTSYIFRYDTHEAELREFIKQHIKVPNKRLPRVTNHRERKGSFFTPKIWVDLSQKYLADALGDNWQDEYYIWDCAAGTGNLLNGLTNKYHIWASTLDQQDVDVMKDRIKNGANLLESHVFQFDFLNDEFTKLPQPLQDIINDPEKRKKLVVYINPPYAEAGNKRVLSNNSFEHKNGVAVQMLTYKRYRAQIGISGRELFSQFLIRIYKEIPGCWIANFSKLKHLQSPLFFELREVFFASLKAIFIVPAETFDNVRGQFPIGFQIWDTTERSRFLSTRGNVYDRNGNFLFQKVIASFDNEKRIVDWLLRFKDENEERAIGFANNARNDFQNQNFAFIVNKKSQMPVPRGWWITSKNLRILSIHLAVRHVVSATWYNDRDLFLAPNDNWYTDSVFQNNCLAFTLFTSYNTIQSQYGINHWIPFTEQEVNAKEEFKSHFMTDFISGRCATGASTKYEVLSTTQGEEKKKSKKGVGSLLHLAEEESFVPTEPLIFSPEATAVFDAGRELWRYYHAQPNANPNASYYDIREHFQGRNEKGKMNPKSDDAKYMRLLANLKEAMEVLRQQIVPKVYEYGFLIS